jgi:putative heme iron utilization protein
MKKQESIANARRLLRQSELGVLSTHSKANEGYPFGSVSTYLSTVNGDAVFYISDLAQHTKNINDNAKMCLTTFANSDAGKSSAHEDPNAGARLSILGSASALADNEVDDIKERFFKLYPDSRKYQGTHDFKFYKLVCERVRFIGGFGDIHWISEDEWRLETPEWLEAEQSMIEHMNEDHMDAMQLMYEHNFGNQVKHVEMLAVNPDGCFISADAGKPVYIAFDQLAYTGQDVRQQLVALTDDARAELAGRNLEKGDD